MRPAGVRGLSQSGFLRHYASIFAGLGFPSLNNSHFEPAETSHDLLTIPAAITRPARARRARTARCTGPRHPRPRSSQPGRRSCTAASAKVSARALAMRLPGGFRSRDRDVGGLTRPGTRKERTSPPEGGAIAISSQGCPSPGWISPARRLLRALPAAIQTTVWHTDRPPDPPQT